MLTGRKLLLADDSLTIRKIVEVTFADEGMEVLTVSDGEKAIEKLEEVAPDIVLADTFMPRINGYEVCRYIKQNAKLKHIPVVLLVGSFEPFDEAEARGVGADEILTKPFQSIRNLIAKVSRLVGGKPPEEELPTAELPHVDEKQAEKHPEPAKLSTEELEITTADTQPLPMVEKLPEVAAAQAAVAEQLSQTETTETREEQEMDTVGPTLESESSREDKEVLLDLGDVGPSYDTVEDDFVLDIDLAEVEPAGAYEASVLRSQRFVEPRISEPSSTAYSSKVNDVAGSGFGRDTADLSGSQFAATQEWPRPVPPEPQVFQPPADSTPSEHRDEVDKLESVVAPSEPEPTSMQAGQIGLNQLSPEAIDAIARRAVEMLSEKVVQEIAWEVVPQLAELMIKRKLEEKELKQ